MPENVGACVCADYSYDAPHVLDEYESVFCEQNRTVLLPVYEARIECHD